MCSSLYRTHGRKFSFAGGASENKGFLQHIGFSHLRYNNGRFFFWSCTLDRGHMGLCRTSPYWKGKYVVNLSSNTITVTSNKDSNK